MHYTGDVRHDFFHRRDVADMGGNDPLASLGFAQRRNVSETNERIAAAQPRAQRGSNLPRRAGDEDTLHISSLAVCCARSAEPALVGANISLRRRLQVLPREFYQFIAPRGAQRLDHIDVIATRPFQRLGKRVGIESDSIDLLLEGLDGFNKACVAAQFEQRLVEVQIRSEEHTSELQSHSDLVCRLLLEKKKTNLISLYLQTDRILLFALKSHS